MLRRLAVIVVVFALSTLLGACGLQQPGGSGGSSGSQGASGAATSSQAASSQASEPEPESSQAAPSSASASSQAASSASSSAAEPETPDYTRGRHHAKIKVKRFGSFTVELYPEYAPKTVKAFCTLVEDGYYDGMTVYWVLNDMYARLGDRSGKTAGKHVVKGEYKEGGYSNNLSLKRGTLAMSRTESGRNSDASSLIVVLSDLSYLDGKYAAFGKVTDGMEVIDEICSRVNSGAGKGSIATGKDGEILDKEDCPVVKSIRMVD